MDSVDGLVRTVPEKNCSSDKAWFAVMDFVVLLAVDSVMDSVVGSSTH